jgi:hypothetical protein
MNGMKKKGMEAKKMRPGVIRRMLTWLIDAYKKLIRKWHYNKLKKVCGCEYETRASANSGTLFRRRG